MKLTCQYQRGVIPDVAVGDDLFSDADEVLQKALELGGASRSTD